MFRNALVIFLAIFCTASIVLQCVSCQGNNTKENINENLECDTMPAEEVKEPDFLPDTSYPSTEHLQYDITIFDTATPGNLSNTDDAYKDIHGILTFRGSPFRDATFCGHIDSTPTDITIDWEYTTEFDNTQTSFGTWGGGTGWTGQPIYINWSDEQVEHFKHTDSITENFDNEEIIIASLSGYVHFINYRTGLPTRKKIDAGNNIKGTPSLDPSLNGNLYVGHGIPRSEPIGAEVINLNNHAVTHLFPRDKNAWRGWGAYDASPLIVGGFLFRIGENGTIYKFTVHGNSLKLHSTLRYRANGCNAAGMESSMAVYKNYGYTTDNHGNILCINLENLHPIWYYDNHDDTDASPVLEIEDGIPYLYSGCEIDRQGTSGLSYFVKLNGLTGERQWQQTIECKKMTIGTKHFDGGMYSTPLLGKGNCKNLIFTNICLNDPPSSGKFFAFDKYTGEIVYSTPLKCYAWSSPVAIMNDNDEMFVFTGDTQGRAYVIDGKTGKILINKQIGINFESSPIIIDNHIVIGSRGTHIYKLSIQ